MQQKMLQLINFKMPKFDDKNSNNTLYGSFFYR